MQFRPDLMAGSTAESKITQKTSNATESFSDRESAFPPSSNPHQ